MRINGFYLNEKNYLKKWIYIILTLFCIGICIGTSYLCLLKTSSSLSVNNYLLGYFNNYKTSIDKLTSFKSSLIDNLKFFTIIFISGFFKPGFIIICGCSILKGFITGFTIASFIKLYKLKGLIIYITQLPSLITFLPVFILFCSYTVIFCINRHKSEKTKFRKYILLSICCLTIFCATSFFDGYLTTTFMSLLLPYLTK